jgi:hypothetical protein
MVSEPTITCSVSKWLLLMTKKELKIQAFGKKLMKILKNTRNVLRIGVGADC